MYIIELIIHNLFRWVILFVAISVLYRSYRGWLKQESWHKLDKILGLAFTILLDLQLVLGLLLLISQDKSNWGRLLMDHVLPMVIAVGLVHTGKVLSSKGEKSTEKYRIAALWYSAVLLIILVAIPW